MKDAGLRFRPGEFLLLASLAAAACESSAPDDQLMIGAEESALSTAEMAGIYEALAERFPSSAGVPFSDPVCGDLNVEVEQVDLNRDGRPETFVHWGNACTSGMTGRSITMFSRDRDGKLTEHFGFPAYGFEQLPESTMGYSDLQFGGPGFCFPVWAWKNDRYEYKCSMPQEPGGCAEEKNICPALNQQRE